MSTNYPFEIPDDLVKEIKTAPDDDWVVVTHRGDYYYAEDIVEAESTQMRIHAPETDLPDGDTHISEVAEL